MLLKIDKITKHFGGLAALKGVRFDIGEGEILGLIGPNGSGKTTLINIISNALRPTAGKILFEERDITKLPAHIRLRMGISRTFQHTLFFGSLSAFENVAFGCEFSLEQGWNLFRRFSTRKGMQNNWSKAVELLRFTGLLEAKDKLAASLSHKEQKLLNIAIAMSSRPKLMLLDEPLSGMSPAEVQSTMELIKKIRDDKEVTILLVEHNMKAVVSNCDKLIVLNYGEVVAEGSPQEVVTNINVIEAYLGSETELS